MQPTSQSTPALSESRSLPRAISQRMLHEGEKALKETQTPGLDKTRLPLKVPPQIYVPSRTSCQWHLNNLISRDDQDWAP